MTKSEFRKIYLGKQRALAPADRAERSGQIADRFFESFDLAAVKFLHCFLPIERTNEIDTKLIFDRLWRDFPSIETCVPRVDFTTGEIESVKFVSDTELKSNVWEIHEPVHAKTIDARVLDIVLAPLLSFDERGYRVGYGKGFYDRFLSRCRLDCLKIGLSFFPAAEQIQDAENYDIRLDFCVTPDNTWRWPPPITK